ncbi:MAG TPA: hypothetical protein VIF62_22260 [Labilithrix sp.]|jgi:hypothetical protein
MRHSYVALAAASILVVASARADEPAGSEASHAHADMDVAVATMRTRAKDVQERLRLARRRGSATEIACLDAALSRADVAVRRARDEEALSIAAYASGDIALARLGARHVFEIANAQSFVARDALACGAARIEPGTRVSVDVDPRIPRIP